MKETIKQPEIKDVLNNLPKEELISIILDIAKNDLVFENNIIFRYSKGNNIQEMQKCKKLIDSIVRKYAGREEFIDYRETWSFASEMGELLDKVRNTKDAILALDIAFLVLDEAIESFQYSDDSAGEIGSLVAETIGLIGEIAIESKNLDINLREKVFNKLLEHTNSEVFDGWEEYRIDILKICAEFINEEVSRNKLRTKIGELTNRDTSSNYTKYSNESMLTILFNIIEEYGTKEESEQFIKDNLVFTSFRELFINKYIKEKDYNKVIEVTLEGEKQDKQYTGLILKWQKIRYTAYKELSLKEEQQRLAKEILFSGNFEYYSELKELVKGDKLEFYNNLKQELKNAKTWQERDIYLKLIVEENDLDAIMEVVRKNPKSIETYAPMLVNKFREEVIEIYNEYIKSRANDSTDRKYYQEVCKILKRYKEIAGKENQEYMINELRTLYTRRPAFIDELSKIN